MIAERWYAPAGFAGFFQVIPAYLKAAAGDTVGGGKSLTGSTIRDPSGRMILMTRFR
jgi:hypothetical protein